MTSPSSPASSLHVSESATLSKLIAHFVAAKRSLAATNHVYRANDIVDTARSLIEECAILGAKNHFLQRGVNDEANALTAVRDGLDSVARVTNDEFKVSLVLNSPPLLSSVNFLIDQSGSHRSCS